ncbi:MAG TPA: hypothetical protein VE075_03850, partial [Thermoanaerobaculia bacterium]|nr:hypothetical protein [Thermoanaerobaculia bacterium]
AARRAAAEALPVLRQLVTRGNAQAMGFRSADEAARATLQEPLRIFLVRLDPLRKFHAGQDPQELLTGGDRVLFPLAVDGEVRSSVEVDGSGGHWRTAGFGRPALVRALAAARDKIGASPGSPAFAVHVAALNLYFVGKRDGGQLLLAAVIADPRLKLALGETRPAQEVFAELVPLAQKYNGLPE